MAEILLIWNTDPVESATTLAIARSLKPVLEKLGHTARIVKVPFKYTLMGVLYKGDYKSVWDGKRVLRNGDMHSFHRQMHEEHPDAIKFYLHNYQARKSSIVLLRSFLSRGNLAQRNYRRHLNTLKGKIIDNPEQRKVIADLAVIPTQTQKGVTNSFDVEVPAMTKSMYREKEIEERDWQGHTHKKIVTLPDEKQPRTIRVGQNLIANRFPDELTRYFFKRMDLRDTKEAGYLSESIIKKVAGLINATVKRGKRPNPTKRITRKPVPKKRK